MNQIKAHLNNLVIKPNSVPNIPGIEFDISSELLIGDAINIETFDNEENYNQYQIGCKKIKDLVINLGSDDVFRISCVNHKINLAIRTAIIQHPIICEIFKKLNKFCDNIRSVIVTNNVCKDLKARLRLENNTRWGSAFMLLEVYKKAFDRGVFDNMDCALPYNIAIIELLLEILKPAYVLVLNFQSKMTSLADVIPVLFSLKF